MSILSDRPFLELCQKLQSLGVVPSFLPGECVARGFADLGFEEFCVLPGPRILSLLAGTVTPLPVEERNRFFLVPSVDQLVQNIDKAHGDVELLEHQDRRTWRLVLRNKYEARIEHTHPFLRSVLLLGLLNLLEK